MKFKFNKKEAVKIIQSTKNFNTDHVDQQDLTEAAILSVKQMRKNMLNRLTRYHIDFLIPLF